MSVNDSSGNSSYKSPYPSKGIPLPTLNSLDIMKPIRVYNNEWSLALNGRGRED